MCLKKQNCWEYMKCGRETNGKNAADLGICPAAAEPAFDGFNQGINAGRVCWLVAGTFCKGKVQGSFAEKHSSCKDCEFYKQVETEEGITRLHTDTLNIVAMTHMGLKRKNNEDRYLIRKLADGSVLLAIADGLGGEVAGNYAAEIIRGMLAGVQDISKGNEQREISCLVKETDLAMREKAEEHLELYGMGTTLICVLLRGSTVHWVHVGDSRFYMLRQGELIQITEDQTFARFLVEEGEITPEQALTHYSRNVMDQCVGCGICEPETGDLKIKQKDVLILSTDGLHGQISTDALHMLLNAQTDIESKADSLIHAALDSGGKDNISLILCEVKK